MAVVKNVIHKGGAWYSWIAKDGETVIKLQGKLACVALLKANQEEYEYLKELVINSGVETPTELLAVEEQDEELD
jgi:hypothetical protein